MTAPGARRLALPLAAAAALAVPAAPASAESAPELRSARFSKPAIAGRVATLQLRARDKERAVSGALVAFGGEGAYGTSACRTKPRRDARRNRTVTLSVPHRFATAGPRDMVVRLDTGGCKGGGGSLVQPFIVTPVEPGQPPQQPVANGSPLEILATPPGGSTMPSLPALPNGSVPPPSIGLPDVPGLPGVPAPDDPDPVPLPEVPEVPGVPVPPPPDPGLPLPDPELPAVPDLPGLPRAVAAATGCPGADTIPTARNARRIRRATICLVNVERAAHGLRRLRHDRRLSRTARRHSSDMVRRAYFAHVAPDGGDLVKRLTASRWLPRPASWLAGENLGFGETPLSTPRATVIGWMNSTGHRENNLDPAWRLAGVGTVLGLPGLQLNGATYTAVFAR